jgi:uncharacterized protein (UPF0333 family)
MFLEIVLTILVIVLVLISVGIYFWWKNYGKKLFDMIEKIQTIGTPKKMDMSSLKSMDDLFKEMNGMFSKFKK